MKDAIVHECAKCIIHSVLRLFHSWLDEMKKKKKKKKKKKFLNEAGFTSKNITTIPIFIYYSV